MKKFLLVLFLGLPLIVFGQERLTLGMNIPALLMGTVDLRLEKQLSPILSLQLGTGIRIQDRDTTDGGGGSFINALNRFIGIRHRDAFLSAGIRIFENSPYEYPYLAVELAGVYYDDVVLSSKNQVIDSEGFAFAATMTLGFVINMGKHWAWDLGLQFGYATPREEPPDYYYPGVGYTTFGFQLLSVRGLHMQPIIALKYHLVRNKRDRIKDED